MEMNLKVLRLGFLKQRIRYFTSVSCVTALVMVNGACAQNASPPTAPAAQPAAPAATPVATQEATNTAAQTAPKIPADQLDSLVSPLALFPDPLLSQTLVASTYPLELIQLQQWLEKNKNLKDKALTDAVSKQPWDPSIQAMAALPDLVT